MENCPRYCRCLICHRMTPQKSSTNETSAPNATLLQHFLNCFQINVLDSELNDLYTSCQFCPTCGLFIAEWSSVQIQMTQLTRRAAQLKATLSALLLSAPQVQEQNHSEDVTVIINNKITNYQEGGRPLLLQQTVDDIRNELRKKYLVNVMVDKSQLPRPTRKLNQEEFSPLPVYSDNNDEPMDDESQKVYLPNEDQFNNVETSEPRKDSVHVMSDKIPLPAVLKLEPLPVGSDNVDEAWNHWECGPNIQLPVVPKIDPLSVGRSNENEPWEFRAHDADPEYLPDERSEDEFNDVESPEQFLEMRLKTEVDGNYNDFLQASVGTIEMNVKAASSNTNRSPKRKRRRYSTAYTTIIPNGPNRFKYNGYDVRLNDEDKCYYCGVCNFNGSSKLNAVLRHIRDTHYTLEDKIKFTTAKISNTEYLYGGKYKIIKDDEKTFKCATCGTVKSFLQPLIIHIRTQHVDKEVADEVVPVTDTPCANDLTPNQGEFESVPYTFNPADKKFTCGLCGSQVFTFANLRSHIRQSHSAKKTHECETCGKSFSSFQNQKHHQRLHTGEKPFECQICGQKFPFSGYLTRHHKSAHGIQPEFRRVVKVCK